MGSSIRGSMNNAIYTVMSTLQRPHGFASHPSEGAKRRRAQDTLLYRTVQSQCIGLWETAVDEPAVGNRSIVESWANLAQAWHSEKRGGHISSKHEWDRTREGSGTETADGLLATCLPVLSGMQQKYHCGDEEEEEGEEGKDAG